MLRVLVYVGCFLCVSHLSAQTVVVKNVHGYGFRGAELERFATLIVVNGKVDRRLNQDIAPPPNSTVIDGQGRTLLPGLIDAHGHVLEFGTQRLQADLRGAPSLDAALERVREHARASGPPWVLGRGWNQVLWRGRQFPTARDLDRVVADRPALMTRVDGHAIWVNSAALRMAGISRTTPDPSGGQILRDAQGNPTGVLVDTASSLVERHLPATSDDDVKRALSAALSELAKLGLTGVHDAGIDVRTYRNYQALARERALPIRIYAMLADSTEARTLMNSPPKPAEFDGRLTMRAVKAWADGALGSRGAALLEDYSDRPGHRGTLLYTPARLEELAKLTAEHGWQLNVHAIGDAGNRVALDAFEKMTTPEQRMSLRPRIEHAQIIALDDIPRFAKLKVIASIQPTHATSDMNMAEDRVGPNRIEGGYAWRKLKDAGVHLAGGSDFPVELANPFHGLYAAVTRKSRDGKPPQGWRAKEKLTRVEALQLFTTDAAFAAHMEKETGALATGQWADFILVDRDYFSIPEDQIDDVVVSETYVAGKRISSE